MRNIPMYISGLLKNKQNNEWHSYVHKWVAGIKQNNEEHSYVHKWVAEKQAK